jgi:hypothetical protein
MSASKQNFFAAHWDWLAAVAGFASLAAAVAMYALSLGDSPEASADAFAAQLKSMKPAHEGVQSANLDLLQKALRQMKTPPHLESVNAKKANFLASEGRVFCQQGDADNPKAKKACGRPIPADAEACPFCGVKQHVVKIEADADHDGMPNEWENRYGLNPNDPGDAKRDLDGDGFTNYEEFVAKTDPKSKESHPDYLDSLVVSAPLKHTSLPFYFYGYSRVRDGYRFTFRRKDAKSKFDSTFSALMNDEIGSADGKVKTGWKVTSFTQKEERRTIPGSKDPNLKRAVDVSTVELRRAKDGKTLTVAIRVPDIAVETETELTYKRGAERKFTVSKGTEFELNGSKYRVEKLAAVDNGCAVTVVDLKTKKEKIVR